MAYDPQKCGSTTYIVYLESPKPQTYQCVKDFCTY